MTAPETPYTKFLAGRDALQVIPESIAAISSLTRDWTPDRFERPYAPGKWSALQVLTHLAQTELALGSRARLALTMPDYTAHAWDQDLWIPLDAGMTGREAADAFLGAARMNQLFFEGLSAGQRAVSFAHPEYGRLTVDWILYQMAGHQVNHLLQLLKV
jgi:hypothetical protein